MLNKLTPLLLLLLLTSNCCSNKLKRSKRSVGGRKVDITKYPFFVYIKAGPKSCGGVRLTNDIVLTVQHCAKRPFTDYLVGHNVSSISVINHRYVDWFSVIDIVHHPNYINTLQSHYDLSVLKLDTRIDDYRWININEYDFGAHIGFQAQILGWGNFLSHEEMYVYGKPRIITLNVLDPEYCLKEYEATGKILGYETDKDGVETRVQVDLDKDEKLYKEYNFMKEVEICMGDPDNFKATTHGDSGSPAFYTMSENQGKPYLLGLVSYGQYKSPDATGGISVIVRLSKFSGWINKTVEELHTKHQPKRKPYVYDPNRLRNLVLRDMQIL